MDTDRKLLIENDPPLQVQRRLAVLIGTDEAMALQQLHWLLRERSSDGWVRMTRLEWMDALGLTEAAVRRVFGRLRTLHLVVADQPRETTRTLRYRVDYDALDALLSSGGNPPLDPDKTVRSRGAKPTDASTSSPPVSKGKEKNSKRNSEKARAPVTDPDSLPDDYPERLVASVDAVVRILVDIAAAKGSESPTRRGVGRVVAELPRRDHVDRAEDMRLWLLDGTGRNRSVRNVLSMYRNQLKSAVDVIHPTPPGGPTRTPPTGHSPYDEVMRR